MNTDDLDDIRDGLRATPTKYPPDYTRLLTVKCLRHGRWLAGVYVRNRRAYVVFMHTLTTTVGDEVDEHGNIVNGITATDRGKDTSPAHWGVRYINTAAPDVVVDCSNRCCTATIPVGWLREQLDQRRTGRTTSTSARYPQK